ncbi:MarR family transcriptional regulator [Paractinoplanes deccanensis]|uniref:MarR family transcriptional regulator n=1 Tax=Paractinoplanes deccanensis TaxID=113561 RepID=A0ABQ3Y3C9_9ACTN|nr:MarR family transcriptional regulator [Actinoplanes deccanensis]GID74485.1 MarR family transcriptional regulator [Actinoplanes deccanensis]
MPGTRRLPTRDQLAAWRAFIETTELLRSRIGGRLHDETGLSPGDYSVMLALSEQPEMRSSDLAAHIGWERSRLSHHLGRMERRGLISREDCATDNRGSQVRLTPRGREAFEAATVPHLRAIRELFVDALTPEQIGAAAEIAGALRTRLKA